MDANTAIKYALRKLLVIEGGDTPSSQQYTDGLEALNNIVKLWSGNKSLIFEDNKSTFTIAANTQEFTIGPTGDYVTTTKPVGVITASIKSGAREYPLKPMGAETYQRFVDKQTKGFPTWLYFRNTEPDSTFAFNLTTNSAYDFILTSYRELAEFPDGVTDMDLPPHFETALKYNLVVELAPEMGAANRVTPLMYQQAEDAKSVVIGRALNLQPARTEIARSSGYWQDGDYNISGYYR